MMTTMTRPTRPARTFAPIPQPPKRPTPSCPPSLQVKTSSLRNPLLTLQLGNAVTKNRPSDHTSLSLHAPSLVSAFTARLMAGSPTSTCESPSIHDNIWRFQERLREMGPVYLYSDYMKPDLYVSAVPLDSLSPESATSSTSTIPPLSSSSSPLQRTHAAATVHVRTRIHSQDGSVPKTIRRNFKLSEVRSTIPEARPLPSSPVVIAPSPVSERSAARKTLFELGISSPVVGPRSAVELGPSALLSPFSYQMSGLPGHGAVGRHAHDAVPMSPFPAEPLVGFERRKSMASLLVAATNTPAEPKCTFDQETISKGLPMHLEYARSYLPVLSSIMLSSHITEGDRIELCLPHPEAWEATVTHIYTGRPSINEKIKENARYLGGKL